ncbi:hypothetical protein RIF29_29660 [Crotalaria pallida]|uniref:Uncharacterized protein n=1 Tax=Crotalaria pallida TaxID=3830 RepID=A0AAN9HW33_CROPI
MMKSTYILFALFFLFAITTTLPSATATVLDTDGYPLGNGEAYYILPVFTEGIKDIGGEIELAKTGNDTCPLTIVQSPSKVSNGLPTIITSKLSIGSIKEGLPLDLLFSDNDVPFCSPVPSKWSIVKDDLEKWSVKLAPYYSTREAYFYIENVNLNNYKLGFRSLSST